MKAGRLEIEAIAIQHETPTPRPSRTIPVLHTARATTWPREESSLTWQAPCEKNSGGLAAKRFAGAPALGASRRLPKPLLILHTSNGLNNLGNLLFAQS